MKISKTNIIDLYVIETSNHHDFRGGFEKIFSEKEFKKFKLVYDFKDLNFSTCNKKGIFRGLHFQKRPFEETKLVKCVKGEIKDYVIDFRKNSSSFMKVFQINLSENDSKTIYIPPGLAHGYQALKDQSSLLYLSSNYHNPESEVVISPLCSKINLNLDLPPILSEKDKVTTIQL